MQLALFGYGKMGKAIEAAALAKGHQVPVIIDGPEETIRQQLQQAEVAIEFSQPEAAVANIQACFDAGVPVVCGTTGWLEHLDMVKAACREKQGALFYASNFSIGVNIFFAINRLLAGLMADRPQYRAALEEIHHTQKLDAPSGTAITIAEGIIESIPRLTGWVNHASDDPHTLPITSQRIAEVPGTHEVVFSSSVDTLTIRHEAHSREGFVLGALTAAEWLIGKQGYFEMKDLLGF